MSIIDCERVNSLLCNDKNIGLHGKMAAWEADSSVFLLTNLRNILTTTFNQCCTFLRLLFISLSSSGACLNSGFIVYYEQNRGKIFQLCKEWQCKNWCGLSARTWGGESSKNILVHTIKIKWNINNSSPWHWNVLNWAWIDYCYSQKAFMALFQIQYSCDRQRKD